MYTVTHLCQELETDKPPLPSMQLQLHFNCRRRKKQEPTAAAVAEKPPVALGGRKLGEGQVKSARSAQACKQEKGAAARQYSQKQSRTKTRVQAPVPVQRENLPWVQGNFSATATQPRQPLKVLD